MVSTVSWQSISTDKKKLVAAFFGNTFIEQGHFSSIGFHLLVFLLRLAIVISNLGHCNRVSAECKHTGYV